MSETDMPMTHQNPCTQQEVSSPENYSKNGVKTEIHMSEKEKRPIYEVVFPDEEEIIETCLKVGSGEIEIDIVI